MKSDVVIIGGSAAGLMAVLMKKSLKNWGSWSRPIADILDTWMDFSVILNSLNRSMGLDDA